ncbi:MAG: hypothetical protein RLZZ338_3242 [Cyanobacteriota bacterium]
MGNISIAGDKGKQLKVISGKEVYKIIDVYEVYLSDFFHQDSVNDKSLKDQFLIGAELIWFWFVSKTWLSFREVPSLFINLLFSAFFGWAWYYEILT